MKEYIGIGLILLIFVNIFCLPIIKLMEIKIDDFDNIVLYGYLTKIHPVEITGLQKLGSLLIFDMLLLSILEIYQLFKRKRTKIILIIQSLLCYIAGGFLFSVILLMFNMKSSRPTIGFLLLLFLTISLGFYFYILRKSR